MNFYLDQWVPLGYKPLYQITKEKYFEKFREILFTCFLSFNESSLSY